MFTLTVPLPVPIALQISNPFGVRRVRPSLLSFAFVSFCLRASSSRLGPLGATQRVEGRLASLSLSLVLVSERLAKLSEL